MTSAQIVETSVTATNSSFQNYTHPDNHTRQTTDTPEFKTFVYSLKITLCRDLVPFLSTGWLVCGSYGYGVETQLLTIKTSIGVNGAIDGINSKELVMSVGVWNETVTDDATWSKIRIGSRHLWKNSKGAEGAVTLGSICCNL